MDTMKVNRVRRRLLIGSLATAVAPGARANGSSACKEIDRLFGQVEQRDVIELWPGAAPGASLSPPVEVITERSNDLAIVDRALTGIVSPRLEVFRPQRPNGAAIMILPGGGYQRVVIDKEGYELGRWLAERGFTAFVLIYRLPGDGWAAGPDVALSDAQRALRLIRHGAHEFGIEAERIGTLGFSAGGHLCADLATRFATATYDPVDEADMLSARPLLAAPIYPVISMTAPVAHMTAREHLLGTNPSAELERRHSPQFNVSDSTPPCFLVHAEDDASVPVANTLEFRAALRAAGIAVETHLFAHGGHGFGLRKAAGKPAALWPELFVNWSRSVGLV